jgi:hypothetical protein
MARHGGKAAVVHGGLSKKLPYSCLMYPAARRRVIAPSSRLDERSNSDGDADDCPSFHSGQEVLGVFQGAEPDGAADGTADGTVSRGFPSLGAAGAVDTGQESAVNRAANRSTDH